MLSAPAPCRVHSVSQTPHSSTPKGSWEGWSHSASPSSAITRWELANRDTRWPGAHQKCHPPLLGWGSQWHRGSCHSSSPALSILPEREPLFVPSLTLKWADFMFYFKNNPQAQAITVGVYPFQFGQPSLSWIACDVCLWPPQLVTSNLGIPSTGHFASGLLQNYCPLT